MILVISLDLPNEIRGGGTFTRRALEVEEANDQLSQHRLPGHARSHFTLFKIRDVPTTSQQPKKRAVKAEHRLDSVVRQIVQRKEATLSAVLALPCGRAIGANAAERR